MTVTLNLKSRQVGAIWQAAERAFALLTAPEREALLALPEEGWGHAPIATETLTLLLWHRGYPLVSNNGGMNRLTRVGAIVRRRLADAAKPERNAT